VAACYSGAWVYLRDGLNETLIQFASHDVEHHTYYYSP